MGDKNVFKAVYEVVRRIPPGRIATYGQISEKLKTQDSGLKTTPNVVGWALHANKDPKVPCHRVVDRNGRLAPSFAFDGDREQRRKLEAEGVKFKDKMYVDLVKSLWRPKSV